MGRFSGKCDIEDWFCDKTDEEIANYRIYAYRQIIPLQITSRKDLIPYYPFLVVLGYHDNTDGRGIIHLSQKSFVTMEENRTLEFFKQNVARAYRRCKRKKQPFVPEEIAAQRDIWGNQTIILNIAKRFVELDENGRETGENANLEGLHLSMQNYYRERLQDEMIKNGWNEEMAKRWVWYMM